jgi:ribose transport system substrate-binding protein
LEKGAVMSGKTQRSKSKLWSMLLLPLLIAADVPTTAPTIFKAKDPKHLRLAVVTNNPADFWRFMHAGMQKFEKESGTQIEFKMPEVGRTEEQVKMIKELRDGGYDGVAIAPVDPKGEAETLRSLGEKTNLIVIDTPCPDANPVLTIAPDNVAVGELVGKHIVELLPDGGKIAVVCGTFKADNAANRLRGIKNAIKDHQIEVVAEVEDETDRAKSRQATADMLAAHPDVKVVVGLWFYEGPAVAEGVADAAMASTVKVVAFDQEPSTLEDIDNGTIESTFAFPVVEMGYQTAKWLHDLAVDGDQAKLPKDNAVKLDFRKIDKSNLADYRKELDDIKNPG